MDALPRGLVPLGGSVALAWVLISLVAGIGPQAWVALSGRVEDAGLFFAVFALAAAAGAALGGRAMDRWGRIRTLATAHVVSAVGYGAAAGGVLLPAFPLFVAGVAVLSFGVGTVGLTRVVAADLATAAVRGRAVARVQLAPLAGALVGPGLLVAGDLLGRAPSPTGRIWLLGPALALAAAFVVLRAPEPVRAAAPAAAVARGPPAPRTRDVAAAFVTLPVAQGAMVAIMGVTGVAIGHAGHGAAAVGVVLMLHFTGMFGPSLLVGRIADRAGRRPTVLLGLATLAAGGLVCAAPWGVAGLAAGLLLVGAGWSFAFLGATVLLADAVPVERRARTTGMADLTTSLVGAGVTALAGPWYAANGVSGLGVAAAALVALAAVAVVGTAWRGRAAVAG